MNGKLGRFIAVVFGVLLLFSTVFVGNMTGRAQVGVTKHATASEVTQTNPEAEKTKIYFYNNVNWEQIAVWAWTMKDSDQLAKNIWPGDEMSEVSDGWYIYEIEGIDNFGILFNNGDSNIGIQTSDCTDLEPGNTYWFITSGSEVTSDNSIGGGLTLEVYSEPFAGWPEAVEGALQYGGAEVATSITEEVDTAKEDVAALSDNVTSGGIHPIMIVIIALAVLCILVVSVLLVYKKK